MKQKFTKLFVVAIILLASNVFMIAGAKAQYTLYLDSVPNVCTANSTVNISLRCKNFNNTIAVMGYQGTILWDPTVLQYQSITYGASSIGLDTADADLDSVAVGKFPFLWFDQSPAGVGQNAIDTTILVTLTFTVKQLITGSTTLSFDSSANAFIPEAISIYNQQNNAIPAPSTAYLSGSVSFISQPTISATGSTLTAVVSGTPSSYQWNLSGSPIPGATDSIYTTVVPGDSYTVTVDYSNGCSLTSPAVLPIYIESFTGYYKAGTASLYWTTVNEAGLSQFNLERSFDGNNFVTIDKVAASNVQGSNYSYLDKSLGQQTGKVYYRLQILDKLGKYTYSGLVSLSFSNSILVAAYPNPAKSNVTISGTHIALVNVIDNTGRIVKVISLKDATNPSLPVNELPAGVYHLRIQTTNGNITNVGLVKE